MAALLHKQNSSLSLPPDLPSIPTLTMPVQIDLFSYNFTLSPPSTAPQCVTDYVITATSCSGGRKTVTVPAGAVGAPVTVGGLNLCADTYTFTAHAVSAAGNGNETLAITMNATAPGDCVKCCLAQCLVPMTQKIKDITQSLSKSDQV